MRSRDELKELAQGILHGHIFSSWSIEVGPEFPRAQWEGTDITEDKLDEMEKEWDERRNDRFRETLRMIFMPLGLADQKTIDRVRESGAVMFYEEFSKAMPRSINGYPMFMSMGHVNQEEADAIRQLMRKMAEALEAV